MSKLINTLSKAKKIFSVQTLEINKFQVRSYGLPEDHTIAVIVYYGTAKRNDMSVTVSLKNNMQDAEIMAQKVIELIESNIKNVKFELSNFVNGKNSIIWENINL